MCQRKNFIRRSFAFSTALSVGGIYLVGCGGDGPGGPGDFPDVRGAWTGRYSVLQCTTLTGTDPFYCQDVFYVGRSIMLGLQLDQSGSRVSGIAEQGPLSGRVDGDIDELGALVLSGRLGVNADATTTIEDWETLLVGDSLVGEWTFLIEDNTGSGYGSARVTADLTLIDPRVPNYESCPAQFRLDKTDGVTGTLGAGDCQLEDETYYDVYSVDMATGDEIEIRTGSPDFRPALLIFDLNENLVACSLPVASQVCSRNSPDSLASISLTAFVGETWLIVVNAWQTGETGSYALTTEALGGASSLADLIARRASTSVRLGGPLDAAVRIPPAVESEGAPENGRLGIPEPGVRNPERRRR